jgi:DNA polymerase I
MLEELESLYRVEECQFRIIYGELDGYRIYCDAKELGRVAEKIELQAKFQAKLYNVDVRFDRRFFAEMELITDEERFSLDGVPELKITRVEVKGKRTIWHQLIG